MTAFPATGTVIVSKPMTEKTSLPFEGTLMEYLPLASVEVPLNVPSTMTVAPGIGAPFEASVTVPVTVTFCAIAMPMLAHRHNSKENNFLLISLNLN